MQNHLSKIRVLHMLSFVTKEAVCEIEKFLYTLYICKTKIYKSKTRAQLKVK